MLKSPPLNQSNQWVKDNDNKKLSNEGKRVPYVKLESIDFQSPKFSSSKKIDRLAEKTSHKPLVSLRSIDSSSHGSTVAPSSPTEKHRKVTDLKINITSWENTPTKLVKISDKTIPKLNNKVRIRIKFSKYY